MKENNIISLLVFLFCFSCDCYSQWNPNPSVNTSVCVQPNDQQGVRLVTDGKGGAIITWTDYRNDVTQNSGDIFVQRIDKNGVNLWTSNGVSVCTDSSDQTAQAVVEDGKGGAIMAWTDSRNGNKDIYAQRIDSSGVVLWTADGIGVSVKIRSQQDPHIISDGANGAIIVWEDSVNGLWDVYAQRLDASGVALWASGGVVVCSAVLSQLNARLTTDGNGGAIFTWQDFRNTVDYNIYAQRLNSSGTPQWTVNGIIISNNADTQNNPKIKSDGLGGAIIAWQDKRNGNDYNVYAQRVNASGAIQWTSNGVAICSALDNQSALDMATDGINGAIISWKDNRSGNLDIYTQRINQSGSIQWTANGVLLSTGSAPQINPNTVGDGFGGATIVWQDSTAGNWDVMAQRIDSSGVVQWTVGGEAVGTAAGNQTDPKNVSDGSGGCIFAWQDKRNNTDFDVYAHHLFSNGSALGINEETNPLESVCFPNPFSQSTIISWQTANQNSQGFYIIIYDVSGRVAFQKTKIENDRFKFERGNLESGIYFYEIRSELTHTISSTGKFIIID